VEPEVTHIQHNNTFSPAPAWTGGKSILFLTQETRMEKITKKRRKRSEIRRRNKENEHGEERERRE
jgi:hypothetical protein